MALASAAVIEKKDASNAATSSFMKWAPRGRICVQSIEAHSKNGNLCYCVWPVFVGVMKSVYVETILRPFSHGASFFFHQTPKAVR